MNESRPAALSPLAALGDARRHSGLILALGLLLVVLGTIGIVSSVVFTIASVVFLGWLLAFGGVALIAHAFSARQWSGLFLQLAGGALNLVVGFMMITQPLAGAAALTLLLAVSLVVQGLFRLGVVLTTAVEGRGWLLLSALATLVLGIMIWRQWPSSALWVIGLFVGIDLMLYGWWLVSLALAVRRLPGSRA